MAFAMVASACDATPLAPTPAGTWSTTPGSPAATGESSPAGTGTPGPSALPETPGPETPGAQASGPETPQTPLPIPSLTEPFAIGEALYDPGRVDEGVVSLLDLMGVGIYAQDGTPVRKGAERATGDPWLTDDEVRGLIEMGVEDLRAGGDEGGPYTLADLHGALAPLLPQVSLAELAAAYSDAYTEHPDDLVPQVMLGQPIEPATPLTRVQLWLLLVDGFVGPADATAGYLTPGALLALASTRPHWGSANANLPPLPTPDPNLSEDEWRELIAHLYTLADTIPFRVRHVSVHEGHGRRGSPVGQLAAVGRATPLVSAVTGRTLLAVRTGSGEGIQVTWRTLDESVLRAHGSLDARLPATMRTAADGTVGVHYTPKKEEADGVGLSAYESASLYATADALQLVERTYVIAGPMLEFLARGLIRGTRVADNQSFGVEWHEKDGIQLFLENTYDVTLDISPSGLSGRAHRKGTDSAQGTLTLRGDGTYRGTVLAGGDGATEMEFAGQTCRGTESFKQSLDVVGIPRLGGRIDSRKDVLGKGAFDGGDLSLHFYPAEAPSGNLGACQGAILYLGQGHDGRTVDATYAPFNDARWTRPDLGYQIHLPASGELIYKDYHGMDSARRVESSWRVEVTRIAPKP